MNFQNFFYCGELYRLDDTKRNAMDVPDFWNQVYHKMFFWEKMADSS